MSITRSLRAVIQMAEHTPFTLPVRGHYVVITNHFVMAL